VYAAEALPGRNGSKGPTQHPVGSSLRDVPGDTQQCCLDSNVFIRDSQTVSGDDHLSFTRRGVAGCELIDFDIPYWHTAQDTPDKIDPRRMAIVGCFGRIAF
jgi:hypothetical protein